MRIGLPRLGGWKRFLRNAWTRGNNTGGRIARVNELLVEGNAWDARILKILMTFLAVLPIVQGLLLGAIFYQLQAHQADLTLLAGSYLPVLAIAYVILLVAEPYLTTQQGYLIEKIARHLVPRSRSIIAEKLLSLDRGTFEARQTQETVTKVSEGAHRLLDSWRQHLVTRQQVIKLVSALVTLLFINWSMVVIIGLCAIPLMLVSMRYASANWRLSQLQRGGWRKYWHLIYYLRNKEHVRDFKLHGLDRQVLTWLEKLYTRLNGQQQRLHKAYLPRQQMASMLVYGAAGAAFLWCMAAQLWTGAIVFGSLSVAISSLLTFNGSLAAAVNSFGQLQQNSLFVGDFLDFLDLKSVITEAKKTQIIDKSGGVRIDFENVWFQYPVDPEDASQGQAEEDKWVLKGLTLSIKPGDRIALVAVNGGGKSTLLSLLLREFDPQKGRILIDGVDLKEVDLVSWYRHLAVLVQGLEPMYLEVGEQFMLASPDASYDLERDLPRLQHAGDLSRSRKLIEKWKHGWRSRIGRDFKHGEVPSGGEQQRLVNGRIFNRQATLYLLDEPTSAVDVEAGANIVDNYMSLPGDSTVILISHAFSNVVKAPRIIVLDDGKVKEDGNHHELLALQGLYAGLYRHEAARLQPGPATASGKSNT